MTGTNVGVLGATEQALRDRLAAIEDELKHRIEEREVAQERVTQVRLEQHQLKIALGGFNRARNPRRRRNGPSANGSAPHHKEA